MSKYEKYINMINTEADIDNETGIIISKTKKIKKRRKIKSCMIGVLAAVMMTTTVAVGASYNWSIDKITEAWFGENTQILAENISNVTAESVKNHFENLKFTPSGSVIDNNMIIIFIDVERTDGNIFDCRSYTVTDDNGNIFYNENDNTFEETPFYEFNIIDSKAVVDAVDGNYKYSYETGIPARQYVVSDDNPKDNKITLAFCFDKTVITGSQDKNIENHAEINSIKLSGGGLEGRKVNIIKKDDNLHYEKVMTEKIEGYWEGELKFDLLNEKQITIEPNQTTTLNIDTLNSDGILEKGEYNFDVKKIGISKMSINLELEGDMPEKSSSLYPYDMGEITMKNGETIVVCPDSRIPVIIKEIGNNPSIYSSDKWGINMSVMLERPIELNDIYKVRFGNKTFYINS